MTDMFLQMNLIFSSQAKRDHDAFLALLFISLIFILLKKLNKNEKQSKESNHDLLLALRREK